MVQIPYDEIGLVIALAFMVMAFRESGLAGRIVIAGVLLMSFVLPAVFPSMALSVICKIGRLLFGAGCFIFWRYRNAVQ
jgi:energy-coupling factor transporter transmembrane protein EcfT